MMTKHYKVAGHTFAVSSQAGFFELMGNYEPFECEGGEPLFSLTMDSGVVPEYTEVCYPIGGIVKLSQAPYNKMCRLNSIEANQNLVCCDWGSKIWGIPVTEGQHQTMNKLASTVPMWHLECLPDEAAARLCYETITHGGHVV